MYAATKAIDFEPPPAVEAASEDVEKWRDELAAEIMKHREIILAKREELLRCWVTAGELNDHQVELVRTLWGDVVEHCAYHIDNQACPDGAPTAEVLSGEIIPPARSVPQGCDMPENMQPASQLRSERVQNGAGQPQNEPAASWNGSKAPAGLVVLFTQPYRNFYTGSAHRYEASAGGEVFVDEAEVDDIADLTRAGCRARR